MITSEESYNEIVVEQALRLPSLFHRSLGGFTGR
jgi:hypothetical protein